MSDPTPHDFQPQRDYSMPIGPYPVASDELVAAWRKEAADLRIWHEDDLEHESQTPCLPCHMASAILSLTDYYRDAKATLLAISRHPVGEIVARDLMTQHQNSQRGQINA